MTVTVKRIEIEPFDKVITHVPFGDGTTNVVVALEFPASCGCMCEIGIRIDNGEKCMLSSPCDDHHAQWRKITERLMADERDTETALAAAINGDASG